MKKFLALIIIQIVMMMMNCSNILISFVNEVVKNNANKMKLLKII